MKSEKKSNFAYSNNLNVENTKVTKAVGVVALATLLSRITGYIRDMFFAYFFGVGMMSDAFVAAFRIPNLFRRLLGEGSLSLSFIPVFTYYFSKGKYYSANKLAINALKILFIILTFVSLIGILLTPTILNLMTPGFVEFPLKMQLTVKLTRIMFPYIIFVGMVALCMGILNVLGHFAMPAFSPVFLNLSMIISLLVGAGFCFTTEDMIIILSVGVLLGGILQLVAQLPILMNKGIYVFKKSGLWHPGFKKIGITMLPNVFGSAVYQINIVISTLLASLLAEGSMACLYYADRVVQFPLGIFGYAFATAILPSLSRQISVKNYNSAGETFEYALKLLLFITIPAMVGLIVLRKSIIELLFGGGAFGYDAIILTSDALLYYAIGLWSFAAVKIVVSIFYAFRDTIVPVKAATLSIIINVFLGIILMNYMGHCGLALATSVSSMVNLSVLIYVFIVKIGIISWKGIVLSVFKTVICALVMMFVLLGIKNFVIPAGYTEKIYLAAGLFFCIVIGIIVFFIFAFIMKIPELNKVLFLIKKKY